VFELTVSKEERRREVARKKRRNARLAKGTVIGACVMLMPILAYLALRV
jgi:hypothetical protein